MSRIKRHPTSAACCVFPAFTVHFSMCIHTTLHSMHSTALLCIRLQLHFVFVSFFCILCAFNACFIPYLLHSKTPLHSQRIWPLLHFYADAFNMHSHSSGHVCIHALRIHVHSDAFCANCIPHVTHTRTFECMLLCAAFCTPVADVCILRSVHFDAFMTHSDTLYTH